MQTAEIISLAIGAAMALLIAIADFRQRKVRLIPLILLLAGGCAYSAFHHAGQVWVNLAINVAIVTGILLLVVLFLRILGTKGLINKRIGLGDVILFYAMGTWFPPAGFVLYFSTGLLFSLTCVLLLMALKKYPSGLPLPLAGLLAAYALLYMPLFLKFEAEILLAFEAGWQ